MQLSTLIDGAGRILLLLEDVVDGHRQARTRSTSIELASSLAPAPTTGIERVTAVHRARSRDHFLMSWIGCSYRSPVPRGPSARRDGTNQGTRNADAMLKAKTPNKQQRAHATRTYWDGSPVPSGPLHTSGGRMHAFTPLGDRGGAGP